MSRRTNSPGSLYWRKPISTACPITSGKRRHRRQAERELEGQYVITLLRSSVEPFLTFSTNRDLREKAYKAWTGRGANGGDTDNHDLIREIVALRAEQARLLGYATYADYKLDDTMAKEPAAVLNLLHQVWEPARLQALAERDLIQTEASHGGLPRRHRGVGLAPLRGAGTESPLRSRRCGDQALLPAGKHGPRHVRHGHQAVRREVPRDIGSAALPPGRQGLRSRGRGYRRPCRPVHPGQLRPVRPSAPAPG